MFEWLLDLLSSAVSVGLVGLAAVWFLSADLVRRELRSGQAVSAAALHPRPYGVALTVAFVALVVLRFVVLGA
jgi:hypothetical protein